MIYFRERNRMNLFSEEYKIVFTATALIKIANNIALFKEHQEQVAIIIN